MKNTNMVQIGTRCSLCLFSVFVCLLPNTALASNSSSSSVSESLRVFLKNQSIQLSEIRLLAQKPSTQSNLSGDSSENLDLEQALLTFRNILTTGDKPPYLQTQAKLEKAIADLKTTMKGSKNEAGKALLDGMESLLKLLKQTNAASEANSDSSFKLQVNYRNFVQSQTRQTLNNQNLAYLRRLKREKPKQFVSQCARNYGKNNPEMDPIIAIDLCRYLMETIDSTSDPTRQATYPERP
jgi:hypothetical protein